MQSLKLVIFADVSVHSDPLQANLLFLLREESGSQQIKNANSSKKTVLKADVLVRIRPLTLAFLLEIAKAYF